MKKIAVLLALCLLFTLGCNNAAPADVPAPSGDTALENREIDKNLPAIELGKESFSVRQLMDAYNAFVSYMSYYGLPAPADEAEVKQYRDMVVDQALSELLLPWKAEQLGISLSEEDEASLDEEVEVYRQEILLDYVEYMKETMGEETPIEELEAAALATVEEELQSYYGYGLDTYLVDYRKSLETELLSSLLQQEGLKDLAVSYEELNQWYDTALTEQKEAIDADRYAYVELVEAYEQGESSIPVLTAPEGFVRVYQLQLSLSAEETAPYTENNSRLEQIEHTYGALVLNGSDSPLLKELEAEYEALKQQNKDLILPLYTKAESLLGRVKGGESLLQLWEENGSMPSFMPENGLLIDTLTQQADMPTALWEACKNAGEEPATVLVEGSLYIVMLAETVEAGDKTLLSVEEACEQAALEQKQADAWAELQGVWLEEAQREATFYKDNYKDVGLN